ncbi:MAG: hypothetical protein IPO98_03050 [Saprospiraceae bacterium]|jgi:hypothetical protein|nr:hypothetical protein [Saprospiraceae bacterium]
MKRKVILSAGIILICSCHQKVDKKKIKTEIFQVENAFEKMTSEKGIFHTVWKKQKDTIWKYVWG